MVFHFARLVLKSKETLTPYAMAEADQSAAPGMASDAAPTDVPLPEIPQQPDLAGTLLRAEHFLGPDLRLQAMTDGTFCLVTSTATTAVDRTTYDSLLASNQAKSAASISSGVTGLRSHLSIKEEIEWGDLDPQADQDPNNYTPDSPIKIERDLSALERLERQPALALLDCYTKGTTESQTSPLYTDYMKSDFNALQIWSPDREDLVSQVLYIRQGSTYVCQLATQPQHRELVIQVWPKFFKKECYRPLDSCKRMLAPPDTTPLLFASTIAKPKMFQMLLLPKQLLFSPTTFPR